MAEAPYNEMIARSGAERGHYQRYAEWLANQPAAQLAQKRAEADALFHRVGITFAVYGQEEGTERLIPFDIVPRVLPSEEWTRLETGLKQRVRALNAFIHDIYHDQAILKSGMVPAEQVLCNPQYRPEMQGMDVPGGIYAHIAGIDIVRDDVGEFRVLEDNLRVPSGVSYMLEIRKMMMRLFPELFSSHRIAPVDHYPDVLLENLRSVAPTGVADPTVAVLPPGANNSAYFEHAFLAQQMGVELIEGQDLFVRDESVFMRTTQGPQRVDVIYRRIDDDFLDPLAFRPDSMLGVPGLLTAYRAGRITIANAIGTMMRDEAFHFTRIGAFLERGDNTARLLKAHQEDLVPGADAGEVPDPFEWSVLLRSLSAFEVYRKVYRSVITPTKVAEMLILRDDMPRGRDPCALAFRPHGRSDQPRHSGFSRKLSGPIGRSGQSHFVGFLGPRGSVAICKCTFDTKRFTATNRRSSTASKACTSRRAAMAANVL